MVIRAPCYVLRAAYFHFVTPYSLPPTYNRFRFHLDQIFFTDKLSLD